MRRIYFSDKDTFLTNRKISGIPSVSASLGQASSFDIFKIVEDDGSIDQSVGLIHFDTEDLKDLFSSGKIKIDDPSFFCEIVLKDVYGGQPCPREFYMTVSPLSMSFDEGLGKDNVYYLDNDVANFISSSRTTAWHGQGASISGSVETGDCDYFGTLLEQDLGREVYFEKGEENLILDVTHIVSATLAGFLPDSGYRFSLSQQHLDDEYTYFVKRFGTRHAYDQNYRPVLRVGFDDSIQDTSGIVRFNTTTDVFLYSRNNFGPANLLSGSSQITGSNCLLLSLSSSYGDYTFTGSQYQTKSGIIKDGTYVATVDIPLTQNMLPPLQASGSVKFLQQWKSLDESVIYSTSYNSILPINTVTSSDLPNYTVNVYGIPKEIKRTDSVVARVNVFDSMAPQLKSIRSAVDSPSVPATKGYYSIRNAYTGERIVDYDDVKDTTRLSLDAKGPYFVLDGMCLNPGSSYAIDVMLYDGEAKTKYSDVSAIFRVV